MCRTGGTPGGYTAGYTLLLVYSRVHPLPPGMSLGVSPPPGMSLGVPSDSVNLWVSLLTVLISGCPSPAGISLGVPLLPVYPWVSLITVLTSGCPS